MKMPQPCSASGNTALPASTAPSRQTPHRFRSALTTYSGPGLIVLTLVVMAGWTWEKWADPVTDFGREVYVPWRLLNGEILYRDIHYFNGPLSPYFNAACFRLFGTSLRTQELVNLTVLAALTALIYCLLLAAGDAFSATVACIVFLALFGFGQFLSTNNYNYICPYSHELPHGLALSLAAIGCQWMHWKGGGARWLAGAGFLLGAVWLTKAEVFLAAALALSAGLFLTYAARRTNVPAVTREVALFVAAALFPVVLAFALLRLAMPGRDALLALAGSWKWMGDRQLTQLRFFREISGTLDIRQSLRSMAMASLCYALLFLPALICGLLKPRFRAARLMVALLAILTLTRINIESLVENSLRPLPLILLVLALALFVQFLRTRGRPERVGPVMLRLMLTVFGAAMLLKMLLNVHLYHYGFALAMPGTMVLVAALTGWGPAWINHREGDGQYLGMAAMSVLVLVSGIYLSVMRSLLRDKVVAVSGGPDHLLVDRRGIVVNRAAAELSRRVSPGQTLVMAPEGLLINYLARIPNPTPHLNFTPPAVIMYGEQNMLRSLEAHPPDFIGLVHVDSSREYGAAFFGQDYALLLGDWIRENYREVAVFGGSPMQGNDFGITILQRKVPH